MAKDFWTANYHTCACAYLTLHSRFNPTFANIISSSLLGKLLDRFCSVAVGIFLLSNKSISDFGC